MERVRKGSNLPKKKWGSPSIQQKFRRSSDRKGHQLYILLSFDPVRALEIGSLRTYYGNAEDNVD